MNRLLLFAVLLVLSGTGFSATVTKVDSIKETAILKLNKAELGRLDKGQEIIILSNGESVEARIEAISGKSAKVKIIFGIESLSEGDKVEISSGSGKRKSASVESTTAPNGPAFSFGSGGAEHPMAGELQAPWVLNGSPSLELTDYKRTFNFMNPAQTMRVKKHVIVAGLNSVDAKASEKTDSSKQVVDYNWQAVGFTGVMHVHNGFRMGLGYEQRNITAKSTVKGTGGTSVDSKTKLDFDVTTLLVSLPFAEKFAAGAEYAQTNYKLKLENSDRRSISSNILRPGVIYYAKDMEAGLKYSPPISVREDGMSYQDPRRVLLHVQKKSDSMRSTGASIEHVHANGVDEDSIDYLNLRIGMSTYGLPWGGWGLVAHYKSKSYDDKKTSAAANIPAMGLTVLGDYAINRMSAIGLDLSYSWGDAKAAKSALTDDKTTIKLQHLAANLTYRYAM